MIELTKEAALELKNFSKDEEIGHFNVRIKICGGGCAGLSFDMLFEDLPITDIDEKFEQEGITIIIDCISLTYIENGGGVLIDYLKTDYGTGYKFILKNETVKSCGCGSSFGVS